MKKHYKIRLLGFIFMLVFSSDIASSQLEGNYTIGTGGDYTTITSAIRDITINGISGPVIFDIKTGVYSEPVKIDSIPGSSASNTVTFQSETGNLNDVTWTGRFDYDTLENVIELNKADHIIFKNIYFYSFDLSIFHLFQNCEGINILNNKIKTVINPIIYFPHMGYAIASSSASTINLTIKENNIESEFGIALSDGSNKSSLTKIINNQIRARYGISLVNHDSLQIEKNVINTDTVEIISPPSINRYSINLESCDKYIKISHNYINPGAVSLYYPAEGIIIQNSNCTNSLIANNFIRYGGGSGLKITNSRRINVYYNTIRNIQIPYLGELPFPNLILSHSSECEVKNNIFGGIITSFDNDSNTSLLSDYNSFYFAPSISYGFNLYYNGNGYTDLNQYKIASNSNFHSTITEVFFVSPTNLHLDGTSIGDTNLLADPIPGIIDDIDGNLRHFLYPYMGADEVEVILPVELNSFLSTVTGRDVLLNWRTLSEFNNSGFYLERSNVRGQKSNEWIRIGFVQGNGTTNTTMNYSLTDKNLTSGNYNYRLKQMDFNGNFVYFHLNNDVSIGFPEKYELSQNYPNPFNPSTNLEFGISELEFVSLKVYNTSGEEVAALVNEIKTAGYYKVKFNASNLPSGVYFYSLSVNNFTATRKMLLLK